MRQRFSVPGLDCPSESGPIRRELEQLADVESIAFDHARGQVTVTGDADEAAIRAAVARTGMRAVPWKDGDASGKTPMHLFAALAGAALLAGIATRILDGPAVAFFALTIAAGLAPVLPRALAALLARRADMHLLMSIAVLGAVAIGEWLEGATVSFLYLVSLVLEAWSVRRAHGAVEKLLELAPDEVVLEDGTTRPSGDVPPGTRIRVAAGARVPLDGTIAEGQGALDESPVTGESLPVDKVPGDEVHAGSVNGSTALVVKTTKPAGESTLAHMARLVEDADARRGRTERAVERFARVYTPAVVGLAVLIAAVPPLFGASFSEWLYRALVLLVIACPCALVISTPVAIVAGLTAAARRGVLVKGGAALEIPATVRAIALDKTGTLTLGRPRVARVVPLHGHDEEEVLARASAIAAGSRHPLSRAVAAEARARGVAVAAPERIVEHGGLGVEGVFEGRPFWLGSKRFAEGKAQETGKADDGDFFDESTDAGTPLYVGNDEHLCGGVVVADELRPDVARDLGALREAAGAPLTMLTGDREDVAQEVARATGVDDVRAQLLPEQKLDAVDELRRRHGPVAMVGDGINDAPALAAADVGIAMGAIGSDAAIETADIALLGDELDRLPWLFRHSRRTKAVIAQNITAALAVKALFVALTMFGWASLWAAIAADTGTTLVVIGNSLRLLRGVGGCRRYLEPSSSRRSMDSCPSAVTDEAATRSLESDSPTVRQAARGTEPTQRSVSAAQGRGRGGPEPRAATARPSRQRTP